MNIYVYIEEGGLVPGDFIFKMGLQLQCLDRAPLVRSEEPGLDSGFLTFYGGPGHDHCQIGFLPSSACQAVGFLPYLLWLSYSDSCNDLLQAELL